MIFVYIVIGLAIGGVVGYIIRQSQATSKIGSAESKAEKILEDAKNKEKELLLDAKSRSLEMIEQAKKQEAEFRSQIVRFEERMDRREKELDVKSSQVDKQKIDLETKGEELKKLQEEIKEMKVKQLQNLERREKRHNAGRGAVYTRIHGKGKIIYYESFATIKESMRREAEVKKWPRIKKQELFKK